MQGGEPGHITGASVKNLLFVEWTMSGWEFDWSVHLSKVNTVVLRLAQ